MQDDAVFLEGLKFNDEVTIVLPAYVAMGFTAAYGGCEWNNGFANLVAEAIHDSLLDPDYIAAKKKELEEQMAAHPFAAFTMPKPPEPEEKPVPDDGGMRHGLL